MSEKSENHDYDLFVIGAGSGGVRAARMASEYGARVGIAEEYRIGGTCVIRGCVPKKLLVYASHFSEEFEDAAAFGWSAPKASFSWAALIANKDKEIARLSDIYVKNLKRAGVEIHQARAVLDDPRRIRLREKGGGEKTVRAQHILIATGATPFLPKDVPGVEYAITSNEAFHLDELPKRIVIVGGGYIAVEFAGIFNGLGAETILLYRGEEILRGFDDSLREALHQEMAKKGVDIRVQSDIARIDKANGAYRLALKDNSVLETDLVMYATGRVPNTREMGLEEAGVKLGKGGAVIVDEYSRSAMSHIFAVGDATNRVNLTPVAIREGAAFAETVFNGRKRAVDHSLVPSAVFSQPQIGTVGLTEEKARALHDEVDVYETRFRALKHALGTRDEQILMKMIADPKSGKVLGVHILGSEAGEMIQLAGVALQMGATKSDFDATIAVHPTSAEELVTLKR